MRNLIRCRFFFSGAASAWLLMCVLGASPARSSSVTLSFTNSPSGVTTTNGTTELVTAAVASNGAPVISSVTLWFQTLAPNCTNLWNASPMSFAGAGTYQSVIPRLPAGGVNYYAACIFNNGAGLSTNISVTNNFNVGTNLPPARQQDFTTNAWSWTGTYNFSSNFWNTTGWTGTAARVGTIPDGGSTDPDVPTNSGGFGSGSYLFLQNVAGANMQTPVFAEGIGSVYFDAVVLKNGFVGTGTFAVVTSTNMGATWSTQGVYSVSGSTVIHPTLAINLRQPAMIQFYRPNSNGDYSVSGDIVIDNATISMPPADLTLAQPTNAISPPFPQAGDAVTLFCNTQDVDTNFASINRRMVAWYTNRYTAGWASSSMTNITGSLTQYSTVLPVSPSADTNKYYFRCDFDGYYYTNVDKHSTTWLPAGATTGTVFQYTITNANYSSMRLVAYPDFNFGSVGTNVVMSRTLTVANDGNFPLNVSAIACPSGFSAAPTSFQVAAFSTSNVTIFFAPTSLIAYGGTITIASDKTYGTNTTSASGTGAMAEVCTLDALIGPSAGYKLDTLSYMAEGTNNYGYALQYRFNWGDGQTSSWGAVTAAGAYFTTNHAWSNLGTNNILAQSRSATNNSILSAWSSPHPVTICDFPIITFAVPTNGVWLPVTVNFTNAAAGSVSNAGFVYSPPGSSLFATLVLTNVSGNIWYGQIPPLSPGVLTYYVQDMVAGNVLFYPSLSNLTFNITTNLDSSRQQNFTTNNWSWTGTYNLSSNFWNTTGWTGTAARVGTIPDGGSTDPDVPTNSGGFSSGRYLFLQNVAGANIQTPVYSTGIGTIYFDAVILKAGTATFVVETSTDNGVTWVTNGTYSVSDSTVIHPALLVNLRQPAMVRFYRPNVDGDGSVNLTIVLDNIVISMPPADVSLAQQLYNPGYPDSKDPVVVSCMVTDVSPTYTPTINRRMTCYFKFVTDSSFTATNMTDMGGGLFQTTIPVHPQGVMSYYFMCSFDGYYYAYNDAGSFNSENIGAEYLPFVATNTVPSTYLTYNIQLFRSENQAMTLVTTPASLGANMTLVDDYTWQALVLVTDVTNLSWLFSGTLYYTNNATIYRATAQYWNDPNQAAFPYPPLGGTAVLCASNSSPMSVPNLTYSGFLVFRFNSRTGVYLIARAAYQDFDDWQASQNNFEASVGLYVTSLFTNDFSAWSPDQYYTNNSFQGESFGEVPPGTVFTSPSSIGIWLAGYGQVILDNGNSAFQMSASAIAPGQVWNSQNALTEGLQNYSFISRQTTVGTTNPAICIKNFNIIPTTFWGKPYRVVSTNRAVAMATGGANVSLSLLMCYQQVNDFVAPTFYEFRLVQFNPIYIQLQLYRWKNYAANYITQSDYVAGQLTSATPFVMDLAWSNNVDIINFTGAVYQAGVPIIPVNNWTDNTPTIMTNGGVVGFNYSDTVPEIRTLNILQSNLNVYSCSGFSGVGADWGFNMHSYGTGWWQTNVAGSAGYLVAPLSTNVMLNIYTATNTATSGLDGPDSSTWTNIFTAPVTSLVYSTTIVPVNKWAKMFAKLQFAGGDSPVLVDNLLCKPWRAFTRDQADTNNAAAANGVSFFDWTSTAQQYVYSTNEPSWTVLEGWVTTNVVGGVTNMCVEFDRTRNNPALDQGILAPLMTNGLGSIAFQATAIRGSAVVYRVDRTLNGDLSTWLPGPVFTNAAGDPPVNQFVPVQMNYAGRMRIVLLPYTGTNAYPDNEVLDIDNLVARDYPPPDPESWYVYNALVARPSTNNSTSDKAFEPTIFDHQTCYLNNSVTNGVLSPGILNADNPYLQSPQVNSGVGEIAFWARAWDNNAAQVTIKVSPDSFTWNTLTNFAVTNLTYQYYDLLFYDTQDTLMRIYTSTNGGSGRLCLDNVLMTEPVRSEFEVANVSLLPAQPLTTNTVLVQAQIDRFILNPLGIQLNLSYYTGTNIWGWLKWRGANTIPSNTTTGTIPLVFTGTNNTYQSSTGIPVFAANTVVQYVVWGTATNMPGSPVFEGTNAFINPSWYYPVDLNQQKAALGWSPYYFVYSCPPGSVWFNEFNYIGYAEYYDNFLSEEYVELCGWANTDLSGWRIDILDPTTTGSDPTTGWFLNASTNLPANAKLSNNGAGWGFLVWGDKELTNTVPGRLDYPFDDSVNTLFPYPITAIAGALRLVRSNGAFEYRIGYSDTTDFGMAATGYQVLDVYKSEGDPVLAPLQLEGTGNTYTNFYWAQPGVDGTWTPGSVNISQTLTAAQATFITVISIVGANGWQSVSSPMQVISGAPASIVYTAASWYRLAVATTNGAIIPGASGTTQFTWSVASLLRAYSNNVSFGLTTSPLSGVPTNIPVWWLAQWGIPEIAFSNSVKNSAYTPLESYWLNLDPVNSTNDLIFRITGFDETNKYLRSQIQLLVTNVALDSLNGGATLKLTAKTNVVDASWSSVTNITVAPATFDTNGYGNINTTVPGSNHFFHLEISAP